MAAQYRQQYPEDSRAVLTLILGILSLGSCGLPAPIAWSIGNTELRAIDAGRRPPENRQLANAGRILGIIGSVLLALGALVLIVGLVVGGMLVQSGGV